MAEKIFKNIKHEVIKLGYKGSFSNIQYDSRQVKENGIFVALEGSNVDGHLFIDSAIKNGAKMIVVSQDIKKLKILDKSINIIKVENTRKSLGKITSNFYGNPEKKIKIIGVTGTNGKTTTAYLLHKLLPKASFIGSTGIIIGKKIYSPVNTTPESLDIIKYVKEAVETGSKYLILEASSEGIDNFRIEGLEFDGVVFTNLSKEHLDYHKTMEEYFLVKERIFNQLKPKGVAVTSIEDEYGKILAKKYPKSRTYGFENGDYKGKVKDIKLKKMCGEIISPNGRFPIETSLIGGYNMLNILATAAIVGELEGINNLFCEKLKKLKYVKGRMQILESKGITIIIDYAHTENALKNLLTTIRKCSYNKLHTLISGTGERYSEKRKGLGEIAARYSDYIMVTSNSPRNEDPIKIIDEVVLGISKNSNYEIEVIRELAVEKIISRAAKGDIVLLTGKGHEEYQEIKGKRKNYNEESLVKKIISS